MLLLVLMQVMVWGKLVMMGVRTTNDAGGGSDAKDG